MKTTLSIVLALFALIGQSACKKHYEDRFFDYGVYKIENRAVPGVLSFQNNNTNKLPLTTAVFDVADPGQRWRLDESAFYTAFELRPTLNENFVMEFHNYRYSGWYYYPILPYYHMCGHTHGSGSGHSCDHHHSSLTLALLELYIGIRAMELGNKLWYLEDAGDGYTLMKNKNGDVCLQSFGMNLPADAVICDNKREQQWKFIYTSQLEREKSF